MLLDGAKAKGIPLSGWKMLIGGAILPQALAREALELGLDIYAGYGMSETCPILTLRSHVKMDRAAARALGCKALPGGQRRANHGPSSELRRKGHYYHVF
jgi:acyl-CoA synthetase (AMP-forming)/AMP-acid ligase II